MKFSLSKLGKLDRAAIELADFTVICGGNNSGKTYATYAIYGFLRMWAEQPMAPHKKARDIAESLPSLGVVRVDLEKDLYPTAVEYFTEMAHLYKAKLPEVFASRPDYFEETEIQFTPDDVELNWSDDFHRSIKLGNSVGLIFTRAAGSSLLEITRPQDNNQAIPPFALAELIDQVFCQLLWNQMVPRCHISSTERTGAAVFHKSLNFARDKTLDALSKVEANDLKHNTAAVLKQLFMDHSSDYPLPVEDNVKLLGELESLSKLKSGLEISHPEILKAFAAIIGGTYKASKDGVYYIPKGSKARLTMSESSSVVRSMLDFSFQLKHVLKTGDLFIVDEPEMSLHPKNQRLFARLLARLSNAGIRILITTHSDYIIRELNALIVLKSLSKKDSELAPRFKYDEGELLEATKVRVYTASEEKDPNGSARAKLHCLKQAPVDCESGVGIQSFDDEIQALNDLQEELIDIMSKEENPC